MVAAVSKCPMHRFILGLEPNDKEVHHKNGNGLDNRRANLEHLTTSKHRMADYSRAGKGAKYVYKTGRRFLAQIRAMGAKINIGMFDTEEEASAAAQEYLRCHPR